MHAYSILIGFILQLHIMIVQRVPGLKAWLIP